MEDKLNNLDFYTDLIEIFRDKLIEMRFSIDLNEEANRICLIYFNLKRRKISAIPRTILESEEFNCPSDLQSGLDIVRERILNGQDLTPHLSIKLHKLDYNDSLLNDWGIYHLHLGLSLEPDGFVSRTNQVLFARFDQNFAYFITVIEHGQWSNQEFVQIIHRNWPDSVYQFRMNIRQVNSFSNQEVGKINLLHLRLKQNISF